MPSVHTVIVCTRNRPTEIERCLTHIGASSKVPRVIIVDSGDASKTLNFINHGSHRIPLAEITLLESAPGLTRQRNVGLRHADSEIVHFIDDDSYVSPHYFERILSTFQQRPDAVGVGGLQANIPPTRPHWTRRLFQLDSGPGKISKAAGNSVVYEISTNPQEVEWLSGCAMSFRTTTARSVGFDEELTGYALGEDLEFCLRLSSHGTLLVNTQAFVNHVRSETNRLDYRRFRAADVTHRARFVKGYPDRFSKTAYAWSIFGITLLTLIRAVQGREGARAELLGIADGVRNLTATGRAI